MVDLVYNAEIFSGGSFYLWKPVGLVAYQNSDFWFFWDTLLLNEDFDLKQFLYLYVLQKMAGWWYKLSIIKEMYCLYAPFETHQYLAVKAIWPQGLFKILFKILRS